MTEMEYFGDNFRMKMRTYRAMTRSTSARPAMTRTPKWSPSKLLNPPRHPPLMRSVEVNVAHNPIILMMFR